MQISAVSIRLAIYGALVAGMVTMESAINWKHNGESLADLTVLASPMDRSTRF